MNSKQWMLLFCLFAIYLVLGSIFFHYVESRHEAEKLKEEQEERRKIEKLLRNNYNGNDEDFLKRLTDYCGKPLDLNMSEIMDKGKWDFYHSLFFVITVVSTIGYGNLAPTTMLTRIVMIFYGLIGIPINGILMVSLGGFFGRTFTKLYQRWKTSNMKADATRLGLISQIFLYAIPGFVFFIFLPSLIIMIFEGWDYDVAVYYAFVTLTTIGFGDIVAGVVNVYDINYIMYSCYQAFLIIWIIGGLGYVVMIIHFITKGMTSKKVIRFEKAVRIAPYKMLRSIVNEFLLSKVKPVYKYEQQFEPHFIERSQSCPDLTIYGSDESIYKVRQRAFSVVLAEIHRGLSETDLDMIDRERTFRPSDALREQNQLILKFMDAISFKSDHSEHEGGVDLFSDSEILESERYGSVTSLTSKNLRKLRRRAVSDISPPIEYALGTESGNTWYGQDAKNKGKQFRERTCSMPFVQRVRKNSTFLQKIKDVFTPHDGKSVDIERQSDAMEKGTSSETDKHASVGKYTLFDVPEGNLPKPKNNAETERHGYLQKTSRGRVSMFAGPQETYLRQTRRGRQSSQHESILEQTSVADFLRALTAVTVPEINNTPESPRRKLGTASLTPPKESLPTRRMPIRPVTQYRRSSLMPTHATNEVVTRRFSLRPVDETSPPSYSSAVSDMRRSLRKTRKFSRPTTAPVQRQLNKREKEDGDKL